ncbi:MAG: single-stranded DNA-binding protein [Candidatus Margulisbacteria bacterium]|nr:single-stranded DNA-binding protein [Candidatus Margulisiibacteriota bacterium]
MSHYNHVTLVGNLVKDPEVVKIGKKSKANFTLAVERYMGKDKEPSVDFFNIVSWGKLAEICGSYLGKGKKVLVDGRIQVRTYKVENERKWITEVVAENCKFLTSKTVTEEKTVKSK